MLFGYMDPQGRTLSRSEAFQVGSSKHLGRTVGESFGVLLIGCKLNFSTFGVLIR